VVLVVAALAWGVAVEQGRVDAERAYAAVWTDAAQRLEARVAGASEPAGAPLLRGLPDRHSWDRCLAAPVSPERLWAPDCEAVRRTLIALPIADARVGPIWAHALGNRSWLQGPPGRHVAAASWLARAPAALLTPEVLTLSAWSLSLLLDLPPPDDPDQAEGQARAAASALRVSRVPLEARCPSCVDPGAQLPSGWVARERSAALEAERVVRTGPGAVGELSPTGGLAARLRAGEAVPGDTWQQPGLAGLAALELARAGRTDALDGLLTLAAEGPTGLDRVAGLYALARLEAEGRVADLPPDHPGTVRLRALPPL